MPIWGLIPAVKDALKRIPEIKSIGASHHQIGSTASGQGIDIVGQTPKKHYSINEYRVQPGFFETLEFKFVQGRPFDEKILTDKRGIIMNETAVRLLEIQDPLNTEVILHEEKFRIIGVVMDFHYASLEEGINPIMFTNYSNSLRRIFLKVESDNLQHVLQKVERVMKEFDSGYAIDYVLLDDFCRNKYGSQEQTETLSTYATVLSLILALLGLYALAMFMVQKRTKEIGIRKVNGANRFQIIQILLTAYTQQVIIAFVIAAPISYLILKGWLENFAYKINLSLFPFIIAGLLALAVALITVAGQTWRAAGRNPVDSLRNE